MIKTVWEVAQNRLRLLKTVNIVKLRNARRMRYRFSVFLYIHSLVMSSFFIHWVLIISMDCHLDQTWTYHSSKRFDFNSMVKTVAQSAKATKPVNLSNWNAEMSQFL